MNFLKLRENILENAGDVKIETSIINAFEGSAKKFISGVMSKHKNAIAKGDRVIHMHVFEDVIDMGDGTTYKAKSADIEVYKKDRKGEFRKMPSEGTSDDPMAINSGSKLDKVTKIGVEMPLAYNQERVDYSMIGAKRDWTGLRGFYSPVELKESTEYLEEKLITLGGKAYPRFGQIVIMAGGAGCFAADTEVRTSEGYKRISDIKTGEEVLSFDVETGEKSMKEVTNTFSYDVTEVLELEFESGEKVVCTPDHEFWIDGQWVKARDIKLES